MEMNLFEYETPLQNTSAAGLHEDKYGSKVILLIRGNYAGSPETTAVFILAAVIHCN